MGPRTVICLFLGIAGSALAQPELGTPHFQPAGTSGETGDAPDELGGFEFGATTAQAGRACERARGRWFEDGDVWHCTRVSRATGFEAKAHIRFCEGRLCEVVLDHRSADGADIAGAYHNVKRALDAAFGEPVAGRVRVRPPCALSLAQGMDASCVQQGERANHYWSAGGFELELEVFRIEQGPRLRVRFQSHERALQLSQTSD